MVVMETLKVQLPEKKARLVRQKAMKIYGYSKGSISKALDKAIDEWLDKVEAKKGGIKASSLTGIAAGLKDSSMQAERKAVKSMGSVD